MSVSLWKPVFTLYSKFNSKAIPPNGLLVSHRLQLANRAYTDYILKYIHLSTMFNSTAISSELCAFYLNWNK